MIMIFLYLLLERITGNIINNVLNDQDKLAQLADGRKKRLAALSYDRLMEKFRQDIKTIIELKKQLS